MTTEQKKFWTGIGIGFAAGGLICGTTCYCVSKNIEHKKCEERMRQDRSNIYMQGKQTGYTEGYSIGVREAKEASPEAIKAAYMQGVDDATLEAQKWIDAHIIQVDSDNLADIQKAIDEQKRKIAETDAKKEETEEKDHDKKLTEEDYAENSDRPDVVCDINDLTAPKRNTTNSFSGRRYMIQHVKSGTTLEYPIELFCDANGFLDTVHIRANILDYEKDPRKLKMIWESMGWGEYYPDEEIPSIETINNWDTTIDTDEVTKMMDASKDDPEPDERVIDRERYMDRVEAYKNNPNAGIKYITYEEYSEESHLDHIRLDYYAGDNVFLQPDSDDRQLEDPITDLGVSNGQILFNENPYKDKDPDLVCIENFGQHFVAEITRYKGCSTGIADGSAYLNGETGVVGGTSGV